MPWLSLVLSTVWPILKKFWSIILVALIVLSVWLWVRGYKAKICNACDKAGYARALKENPPQSFGDNAIVTNIQDGMAPIVSLYRLGLYWKKH